MAPNMQFVAAFELPVELPMINDLKTKITTLLGDTEAVTYLPSTRAAWDTKVIAKYVISNVYGEVSGGNLGPFADAFYGVHEKEKQDQPGLVDAMTDLSKALETARGLWTQVVKFPPSAARIDMNGAFDDLIKSMLPAVLVGLPVNDASLQLSKKLRLALEAIYELIGPQSQFHQCASNTDFQRAGSVLGERAKKTNEHRQEYEGYIHDRYNRYNMIWEHKYTFSSQMADLERSALRKDLIVLWSRQRLIGNSMSAVKQILVLAQRLQSDLFEPVQATLRTMTDGVLDNSSSLMCGELLDLMQRYYPRIEPIKSFATYGWLHDLAISQPDPPSLLEKQELFLSQVRQSFTWAPLAREVYGLCNIEKIGDAKDSSFVASTYITLNSNAIDISASTGARIGLVHLPLPDSKDIKLGYLWDSGKNPENKDGTVNLDVSFDESYPPGTAVTVVTWLTDAQLLAFQKGPDPLHHYVPVARSCRPEDIKNTGFRMVVARDDHRFTGFGWLAYPTSQHADISTTTLQISTPNFWSQVAWDDPYARVERMVGFDFQTPTDQPPVVAAMINSFSSYDGVYAYANYTIPKSTVIAASTRFSVGITVIAVRSNRPVYYTALGPELRGPNLTTNNDWDPRYNGPPPPEPPPTKFEFDPSIDYNDPNYTGPLPPGYDRNDPNTWPVPGPPI